MGGGDVSRFLRTGKGGGMLPVPELNEHILAMELRADKKVEDPDLGLRLRGGTVSHASKMNNT